MIANPNDGNSPRVEVATPMIDVSAGGLITATTEQEKGYVSGGTKSATQQLTTQGAKTVTPTTTNQTAVASGRYTTGDVVVSGDANLVPENIAEGVSIFGVTGTHSGGAQACTLTVEFTASRSSLTIYYISPEMSELQTRKCESGNPPAFTLNVAKNTIAFFDSNNGWGITQLEGDATIIYGNLSQSGCAVYVYGDCRFESA